MNEFAETELMNVSEIKVEKEKIETSGSNAVIKYEVLKLLKPEWDLPDHLAPTYVIDSGYGDKINIEKIILKSENEDKEDDEFTKITVKDLENSDESLAKITIKWDKRWLGGVDGVAVHENFKPGFDRTSKFIEKMVIRIEPDIAEILNSIDFDQEIMDRSNEYDFTQIAQNHLDEYKRKKRS